MSSGSFGISMRNGLKTDTAMIGRHRQRHRRRHRDAQNPHHPAVARGDGKARLQSGLIGWILDRIHRCSEARDWRIIVPGNRRIMQPGHA